MRGDISCLKAAFVFATILSVREDYYQLLDSEPTADKQQLRDAFRRVAKRYHPDLNAGNPAAEEHFKLISEAWRVLGNDEKRAEYDAWLERHQRYARLPELDALPRRRRRVSARRVQERDREHRRAAGTVSRFRPFLLRPRGSKISGLAYVMVSLCFVLSMTPYLRHHLAAAPPPPASAPAADSELGYGESPLSVEEQQRELENYRRRLIERAEKGDATAQFRYGYLLYMGIGGVAQDKAAARRWWELAAANGSAVAKKQLSMLSEQESSPQVPAADAPPAP